MVSFMVEELLPEYSPMSRYYLRVLSTFITIQCIANWLCTFFYGSDLRQTRDRPDVEKCLWDEENGQNDGTKEGQFKDRGGLIWKWCVECKHHQPPRCHHCKICNKCILKRDHHCFFTGTCIGFYNQRYFVILVFYLALATAIYLPFLWRYFSLYADQDHWSAYFLPITIYKWFQGQISFKWLVLTSHWYTMWWGGLIGLAFFVTQLLAIYKGLTSHEMYKINTVRCTASTAQNFRDVFGDFWMLNFIFPTVLVFRQAGDAKHWEHLKFLSRKLGQ